MMHTPTATSHPANALPDRNSYLDESDFGFQAAAPPPPSSRLSQQPYYDPYAPPPPTTDPSWVRAPDGPPPIQEDAYDLGQQRLGSSRAYSDVGSSASLGPDDSASVLAAGGGGAYGQHQQHPQYLAASSLSFVPEEGPHYASGSQYASEHRPLSYNERTGLVEGAESFAGQTHGERQDRGYANGGIDDGEDDWRSKGVRFGDLEYSNPPHLSRDRSIPDSPTFANLTWSERVLESLGIGADKRFPVETRIENRRRGIGRQRRPWVTWILCTAMVAVFCYELARNKTLTGSVISTKPTFNWMIGLSSATLTNMGARMVPCMKPVTDAPLSSLVMCFNETRSTVYVPPTQRLETRYSC